MKLTIASAAFLITAAPLFTATSPFAEAALFGQSARTGVSNPEPVVITAQPDETVTVEVVPAKPIAGRAAARTAAATSGNEVYGAYVPYRAPGASASAAGGKAAFDPDANIVTSVSREPVVPESVLDAGIVTSVTEREGEVREGTLLKARIRHGLSTVTTEEGTKFSAELTEPVMKGGRVILPVGALLEGRVTQVHSGRRVSGAAMIHLDPRSVTLPDGTLYMIHAQLVDTSQYSSIRVGTEGNMIRRDHAKETMAVVGGVTGAGAVAGAMVGGGIGAAVGAGIGAGAGTIVWLKQDRQATLPQDSLLVFSLTTPLSLKALHAGLVGGQ